MKIAVKAGVATGMTMGVRVGGLLILGSLYLFVTLLCIYWIFWRKVRRGVGRTIAGLTVTTVAAVAVMLASWPYALSKPIVRTWSAVTWFSGHPGLEPSPRDYIPRYLLFKFPELVIVLLSIGLIFGIWHLAKSGALANPLPMMSYLVVIFSALFPIVYSMVRQVPLYDEVRHFLFIIPPLICLAGIMLDRLVQLSLRRKVAGSLLIASVGLFLILQIVQIVQLHPYEYAYYNRVIGGIQGASQNGYPVEYWATSRGRQNSAFRRAICDRKGLTLRRGTPRESLPKLTRSQVSTGE